MIWYWANDQRFGGGRKGWSWSRDAALFIHLERDACLMTDRAGSWDGFFCAVCFVMGTGALTRFRTSSLVPILPFNQFPAPDLGFLTWREFLRLLVNTVTTSCLHRVLLVDKGLVCLFSCYTKRWSDHTKSWRGISWAPTPQIPLFAAQVPFWGGLSISIWQDKILGWPLANWHIFFGGQGWSDSCVEYFGGGPGWGGRSWGYEILG